MNIERLAKHLKEFTLDEIEMIAECNCKTELERLLNTNKIVFAQGVYKFVEKVDVQYDIYTNAELNYKNISVKNATKYFMENYVQNFCKKETIHHYGTIFRGHIIPYFNNKELQSITITDIQNFYKNCQERNLPPRRIKNTMALLNQVIKYFQNLGWIDNKCTFKSGGLQ